MFRQSSGREHVASWLDATAGGSADTDTARLIGGCGRAHPHSTTEHKIWEGRSRPNGNSGRAERTGSGGGGPSLRQCIRGFGVRRRRLIAVSGGAAANEQEEQRQTTYPAEDPKSPRRADRSRRCAGARARRSQRYLCQRRGPGGGQRASRHARNRQHRSSPRATAADECGVEC